MYRDGEKDTVHVQGSVRTLEHSSSATLKRNKWRENDGHVAM